MKLNYDYHLMIMTSLGAILERYERDCAYHFIDTKIDIATGKDFYPVMSGKEKFRDKDVIYSWIQGRGLEAMVGHYQYVQNSHLIEESAKSILLEKIKKVITEVMASMEKIRAINSGRLSFCMSPSGERLKVVDFVKLEVDESIFSSEANYSDLFYFKGLIRAGKLLNNDETYQAGRCGFEVALAKIADNQFHTDQQSFDPKNQVQFVPNKYPQGPKMISLLGLAELIKLEPDKAIYQDYAERFIRDILKYHINLGQYDKLEKYDFIEFINGCNDPYFDNQGRLLCDVGHALEFIGLASKCLWNLSQLNQKNALIRECLEIFPKLFLHMLELGYNENANGIIKSYDLVKREPINSDMPWWSLPESMRAAAFLIAFQVPERVIIETKLAMLSESFSKYFINESVFKMAYQTRNSHGEVIEVIPATPDADPGYHTNLSMIDVLTIFNNN